MVPPSICRGRAGQGWAGGGLEQLDGAPPRPTPNPTSPHTHTLGGRKCQSPPVHPTPTPTHLDQLPGALRPRGCWLGHHLTAVKLAGQRVKLEGPGPVLDFRPPARLKQHAVPSHKAANGSRGTRQQEQAVRSRHLISAGRGAWERVGGVESVHSGVGLEPDTHPAAQHWRRAVPCPALPCPAMPCSALPCLALPCQPT